MKTTTSSCFPEFSTPLPVKNKKRKSAAAARRPASLAKKLTDFFFVSGVPAGQNWDFCGLQTRIEGDVIRMSDGPLKGRNERDAATPRTGCPHTSVSAFQLQLCTGSHRAGVNCRLPGVEPVVLEKSVAILNAGKLIYWRLFATKRIHF